MGHSYHFPSLISKRVNSNLSWETSLPVYVPLLPGQSALKAVWLVWTQQIQEMMSLNLHKNLQACLEEKERASEAIPIAFIEGEREEGSAFAVHQRNCFRPSRVKKERPKGSYDNGSRPGVGFLTIWWFSIQIQYKVKSYHLRFMTYDSSPGSGLIVRFFGI